MKAGFIIICAAILLSIAPVGYAYSNVTQEIHRYAVCDADGFCRPEFYVTLDDPLIDGSMRIDYIPSIDPHFWAISITGLANVTVDAQINYDTRGCSTFFVDCPSTTHTAWLMNANQCTLVVDLTTDVPTYFRMVNVPQPDLVTLDGAPASITRYSDGLSVDNFPVGTHQLIFTNPACNPCYNTPGLGITIIAIILLVLWIAFVCIGLYANIGAFLIIGGMMGIVLAMLYLVPCVNIMVSIVILALALVTMLGGAAMYIEEGA
jgi:hypothetical protein